MFPTNEEANKRNTSIEVVPHWPAADSHKAVDSFLAMQLGLWQIFASLKMYSFDLKDYLANGDIQTREFAFTNIFLDWADVEDDADITPGVAIHQASVTTYEDLGLTSNILEETVNRFCENTVVKVMHQAKCRLQATCWLANRDDRGGVRKAIEDAFDSPLDGRPCRIVTIPQYYDMEARYSLTSVDYPDNESSAQSNTWPIIAIFQAEIPVAKLVRSPGYLEPKASATIT